MSSEFLKDERGEYLTWIASNDAGKPICLGGSEGGYSITVYPDDEGRFVGLIISLEEEIIGSVGWVPAEIVVEERDYANL